MWWDYSAANAIRGDVCDPATQNCASAAGWGTPQTIATLDATGGAPIPFECPILAQPGGRASTSPQVDVDRSGGPHHSRVYVTWSDLRAGSGSTRCGDNVTPTLTHLTWDNFVASAAGALPGGAAPRRPSRRACSPTARFGGQANSDDWFAWLAGRPDHRPGLGRLLLDARRRDAQDDALLRALGRAGRSRPRARRAAPGVDRGRRTTAPTLLRVRQRLRRLHGHRRHAGLCHARLVQQTAASGSDGEAFVDVVAARRARARRGEHVRRLAGGRRRRRRRARARRVVRCSARAAQRRRRDGERA